MAEHAEDLTAEVAACCSLNREGVIAGMIASLALVLAAPVLQQKNSLVASSIEAKHEGPCVGKKYGESCIDPPRVGPVPQQRPATDVAMPHPGFPFGDAARQLPAADAWPTPRPFPASVPRMNSAQLATMATLRAQALRASTEATPALLALLDSTELRAALRDCCPHLVNRSATSLAAELRESVECAELVHTFDGSPGTSATIEMNLNNVSNYFPQLWQIRYLRWAGPLKWYGQPNGESTNEEEIYRLPTFQGAGNSAGPRTLVY